MKLRISGLHVIAAYALAGLFCSVPRLAQNAYITQGGGNVSVIDTATDEVTGTISVGGYLFGVAVIPDGSKVYVTDINNGTVSVISTATNQVTGTIAVGEVPQGVAVTPDGSKVYV